jgi:hypothetical protein
MPTISTKSVAERLQVKPGKTVAILNAPADYIKTLGKIPAGAQIINSYSRPADIIQIFVKDRAQLEAELAKLPKKLNPGGAIWVTYYKSTSQNKTDINRDVIGEYAATIGLEGVAIISIDDDWSALRLKVL